MGFSAVNPCTNSDFCCVGF
ncbi:hypothetical protein DXU76_01745 [Fructilactobacillus fructivorans]|uniref:Uncharacterized protein n=1 Tax=Fructilactobacillus fructivorans TaxID=1614 RepID=A0AAE6P3W7_9LACO|nr:hypothetical protein LF543_02665 [Fructilactobacillus fructivorans]RDV65961.1 hypothetical protein DXU76_01745 [Fructilactobacillus fructivorans]